MAKVNIVKRLKDEIIKKFKAESVTIFKLMKTLEENPHKGKIVGQVGGILVKELKYESFRFYFLVDGNKINVLSAEQLIDLLILFVRMSDKKDQQPVIEEIKRILRLLGKEGF